MANLSAPTVSEPLYECASTVVVTGYVPGANVAIFAKPPGPGAAVAIGGGVSNSASGQVFGVAAANMVAGASITGTQTFGGNTSPSSPEAIVQSALSVDAPVMTAPLLECARCVRVDGLLPGVKVEVRDAGAVIGQSAAAGAAVHVGVNPLLAAGHTIKARQVYCGNAGPDSPGIVVGATREKKLPLAAPEVADPLFACQQSCVVNGCTPGCEVELFVDGIATTSGCSAGTGVNFWVSGGLVQGTTITARQSLCGGMIKSAISAGIVVQPAANIPRPAIWPPLYEGDTSVMVGMTVAGEVVTIAADGAQIGMGGSGGGNAVLNVDPPLAAGQMVTATVELCGVQKTSLPVLVLPAPKTVPPPKVVKPLIACSLYVDVIDCIPGAEVRVFAKSGGKTVLLGLRKTLTAATTVWITPPLKKGWSIFATQKAGGITSGPSAAVVVSAPPAAIPTPALAAPILECARCVRVQNTVPGAHVDVFQNQVWVGAAEATGKTTEVSVYPGLAIQATITAIQTVCGKASKAAQAVVGRAPEKMPTPHVQPAFANQSSVVVADIVPGAIVEVEETSVYHQVVGKACALDATTAVGIGFPLFAGAKLRARQTLCKPSAFSPTITVSEPEEWPLGAGPFKAGFRLVGDVPVADAIAFLGSAVGPCVGAPDDLHHFDRPATNKAVIFYPATAEGENTPLAGGGPFHVIVFGPGRRQPSCIATWQACQGAPTETTDDFRQSSGILSHLARWGFVCMAADFSWLADDFGMTDWVLALGDAANYIVGENTKAGSPLQGHLLTASVSLVGHSTNGFAAAILATNASLSVDALAMLAPAGGAADVVNFAPKPVMVVHGTKDIGPFGDGGQSLNVYAAAAPKKHLVDIDGANHFGFTDSLCILNDNTATIAQADQQKIAKAYLTAFFRRYVGGAPDLDDYLSGARPIEELGAFAITVNAQL